VLIVAADPRLLTALAASFAARRFRVTTARNGIEALAAVERERPALLLLDLDLPELDGRGVMRELARRGFSVPLMLMDAGPSLGQAAKELGAIAFLTKPFEVAHLLATAQQWITRSA
jgi:two-component system OmpR family response regulator